MAKTKRYKKTLSSIGSFCCGLLLAGFVIFIFQTQFTNIAIACLASKNYNYASLKPKSDGNVNLISNSLVVAEISENEVYYNSAINGILKINYDQDSKFNGLHLINIETGQAIIEVDSNHNLGCSFQNYQNQTLKIEH